MDVNGGKLDGRFGGSLPLNLPSLRRRLLSWFRRNQRDLPWRRSRDPYAIWISEVMLQQTQAATVAPYFERFLRAFPNIQALAAADLQQVLRLWEGLGYYRRARDLHRAARIIRAEHDGVFPNDPQTVGRLPGFGRYTTNAVLSQAFERRLPILEANSRRLLCRLFGIQEDPRRAAGQKRLWKLAEILMPQRSPGAFNQALMELGALVCRPSAPKCSDCPLVRLCRARQLGCQEQVPVRPRPPRVVLVEEVGVVVWRKDRVLLVQRAEQGRWAEMWEFPHGPVKAGESHEQAAKRLLRLTGISAALGTELATIRHSVTRFRIKLVCLEARYRKGLMQSKHHEKAKWVSPRAVAGYPLSVPQRKIAELLAAPRRSP